MQAHERVEIDLEFRPKSYFWPPSLETHLLSRIKGAERRAALKRLLDSGRLEEIPDFLARSALDNSERAALGRIHPAFMGGEYLPDLMSGETMIARVTIASTTQDVTCVYARGRSGRIHYRVVDEYEGITLSAKSTRTSTRPLTLRGLDSFFFSAWSLLETLEANFGESGYDEDEMQAFVVEIGSSFYPDLDRLVRERISSWGAARRAEIEGHAQRGEEPPREEFVHHLTPQGTLQTYKKVDGHRGNPIIVGPPKPSS
jgi:hypothetical protein